MATATLTRHELPGGLGPLLIDVRSGGRTSPRPAIVVLHGFKGFKDWGMFPPAADRLAQAGFTVVTFNLSGSGVDARGEFTWADRFGRNTYSIELADTDRVIDALERGELGTAAPSSLGLLGHSRGGGDAVLHAARDPRIRALVTWAAISGVDRWTPDTHADWRDRGVLDVVNARTGQVLPLYTDLLDDVEQHGHDALDILAAAGRIAAPWLIVHGRTDESVPFAEAGRLRAASGSAVTELLAIDGTGHTFGTVHPWTGMPIEFDRVLRATATWFARHLQ
jgi:pimeloyl-ACP methyl ester carboxylesterase